MREPMPDVSSSTQPSGALIMKTWLSPSITSALRTEASPVAAAASGLGAAAGAAACADADTASAASAATAARTPADAFEGLPWRGSARNEHLHGIRFGDGTGLR